MNDIKRDTRPADKFKYDTNKVVRAKVDKILFENVRLFANVNTKTSLDVGSRDKAKKVERENLKKVKELDPDFYRYRLHYKD
jgi:hypothetical protein